MKTLKGGWIKGITIVFIQKNDEEQSRQNWMKFHEKYGRCDITKNLSTTKLKLLENACKSLLVHG